MASQVRQNYHAEVENGINKQINAELHASYVYLSLATYFDRDDVALLHVSKWFKEQSSEEREHAQKLIEYQNKRGGRIVFENIQKPEKEDWGSSLEAFQAALSLERQVNQSLIDLHLLSGNHNDPATCDFLDHFLEDQVEAINKLGKFITNLKRVGTGIGEYLFDHEQFD